MTSTPTTEIMAEAERLAPKVFEVMQKALRDNAPDQDVDQAGGRIIARALQDLSDAKDREREAAVNVALENAAQVILDRTDREWVKDSLWANMANRFATLVRALKHQPGGVKP